MASLSQLADLYARVLASPYSDFYRSFFASRAPASIVARSDWESLPYLTKADIAAVPYHNRIYVEPRDVDIIRLTSGTSASGVLAIPRVRMPYTEAEADLMPVDRCMGFLVPHRVYDNYVRPSATFVGGDPARLEASAAIAAAVGIEGIGALPSTLIAFAAPLAARYDITRIRHLCFNGDVCTPLQRASLETLYPGVVSRVSSYGSTETQGLCAISEDHPDHPGALRGHPLVHYEIVDASGSVVDDEGTEGELVVSLLYERAAFPLIRYRTGDTVRLISRTDERTLFAVLGRTASERIRFAAGTILVAEIERCIQALGGGSIVDFEAVISEEKGPEGPLLTLAITLIAPPLYAGLDAHAFAERLARELRISEQRTYAEAVARDLCRPITCTIAGLDHGLGRKRRRLTDRRTP